MPDNAGDPMASDPGSTVTLMTSTAAESTTLRAFRYCLDHTPAQAGELARSAGAARWAFNHALAQKVAAHEQWRAQVTRLVDTGVDEPLARRQVKIPTPAKPAIQKAWNATKGDSRLEAEGRCPWWHEVSTYCFQSAFADADTAWRNWLDSLAGRRGGRRIGYPRFKKRGRARDSFRIHHDVTRPTIRLTSYRRLLVPRLGEIRIHGTAKPLARLVGRGQAVVQSVTISRAGHRWYASILCKVTTPVAQATRAQKARGTVGVDVGVHTLAALSTGEHIPNPRYVDRAGRRLRKAQRALARTQKGSRRRGKAISRVGRLHHETATRRSTTLHNLTKTLAAGWATVAVEDLNVAGMTRSARAGPSTSPAATSRPKPASTGASSTRHSPRSAANSFTKPPGTAPLSSWPTGGRPPARPARPAAGETQACRCPSARSPARAAAAALIATSMPRSTSPQQPPTPRPGMPPSPPVRGRRETLVEGMSDLLPARVAGSPRRSEKTPSRCHPSGAIRWRPTHTRRIRQRHDPARSRRSARVRPAHTWDDPVPSSSRPAHTWDDPVPSSSRPAHTWDDPCFFSGLWSPARPAQAAANRAHVHGRPARVGRPNSPTGRSSPSTSSGQTHRIRRAHRLLSRNGQAMPPSLTEAGPTDRGAHT